MYITIHRSFNPHTDVFSDGIHIHRSLSYMYIDIYIYLYLYLYIYYPYPDGRLLWCRCSPCFFLHFFCCFFSSLVFIRRCAGALFTQHTHITVRHTHMIIYIHSICVDGDVYNIERLPHTTMTGTVDAYTISVSVYLSASTHRHPHYLHPPSGMVMVAHLAAGLGRQHPSPPA